MEFDLAEATKFVCAETAADQGKFFGPIGDLKLGAGLIYDGIPYPLFDSGNRRYEIRLGRVLVLTHECDVEQGSQKAFNSDVLFVPVVSFDDVFRELSSKRPEAQVKAYCGDLAKYRISQLFYIPPWDAWPNGGVLYLNRISSSHISLFAAESCKGLIALSGHGYDKLGYCLQAHLLRAKSDQLPLTQQ